MTFEASAAENSHMRKIYITCQIRSDEYLQQAEIVGIQYRISILTIHYLRSIILLNETSSQHIQDLYYHIDTIVAARFIKITRPYTN